MLAHVYDPSPSYLRYLHTLSFRDSGLRGILVWYYEADTNLASPLDVAEKYQLLY